MLIEGITATISLAYKAIFGEIGSKSFLQEEGRGYFEGNVEVVSIDPEYLIKLISGDALSGFEPA